MKDILDSGIPQETADFILVLYQTRVQKSAHPMGTYISLTSLQESYRDFSPCIFIISLDYVLRKALDPNTELGYPNINVPVTKKSRCGLQTMPDDLADPTDR